MGDLVLDRLDDLPRVTVGDLTDGVVEIQIVDRRGGLGCRDELRGQAEDVLKDAVGVLRGGRGGLRNRVRVRVGTWGAEELSTGPKGCV